MIITTVPIPNYIFSLRVKVGAFTPRPSAPASPSADGSTPSADGSRVNVQPQYRGVNGHRDACADCRRPPLPHRRCPVLSLRACLIPGPGLMACSTL